MKTFLLTLTLLATLTNSQASNSFRSIECFSKETQESFHIYNDDILRYDVIGCSYDNSCAQRATHVQGSNSIRLYEGRKIARTLDFSSDMAQSINQRVEALVSCTGRNSQSCFQGTKEQFICNIR